MVQPVVEYIKRAEDTLILPRLRRPSFGIRALLDAEPDLAGDRCYITARWTARRASTSGRHSAVARCARWCAPARSISVSTPPRRAGAADRFTQGIARILRAQAQARASAGATSWRPWCPRMRWSHRIRRVPAGGRRTAILNRARHWHRRRQWQRRGRGAAAPARRAHAAPRHPCAGWRDLDADELRAEVEKRNHKTSPMPSGTGRSTSSCAAAHRRRRTRTFVVAD